jgi:hypothetical protein
MDECILDTLVYFDIFDYPLTFSEIKKYLCSYVDVSDDQLYEIIHSMPIIQESNGYYYFLGRSGISEKRLERNSSSIEKFAKAKIVAKVLSFIPTIDYIGVSGSLSMYNAAVSDDIDLFFITKKNSLWLTRFLTNAVLMLLKQKRNRNNKDIKDKICPNMFIEKGKLAFSKKRKTLYTAHEIVQLKTLYDRNGSYSSLLSNNKWVKDFFPNLEIPQVKRKKENRLTKVLQMSISPIEKLCFYSQRVYMQRYRTIEVISPKRAFFHPIDRQKIILDMFRLRSKRYKTLYVDNIWVDRDEARFYMEEKKIRILN